VYEDRDRIARDLHDLVIQRLFATGMMLESARHDSLVPEVRQGVGNAVDELDITIQEIRTAIFALQQGPSEAPSGLCTGAAGDRHGRRAARFHTRAPFRRRGRHRGRRPHRQEPHRGLARGLSIAFRHAAATRIEVVVDATATLPDGRPGVRLTVTDDGVGIPEGGRRSGLKNLKRRAESLGGDSRHGPGDGGGGGGGGTTVVWQAPH